MAWTSNLFSSSVHLVWLIDILFRLSSWYIRNSLALLGNILFKNSISWLSYIRSSIRSDRGLYLSWIHSKWQSRQMSWTRNVPNMGDPWCCGSFFYFASLLTSRWCFLWCVLGLSFPILIVGWSIILRLLSWYWRIWNLGKHTPTVNRPKNSFLIWVDNVKNIVFSLKGHCKRCRSDLLDNLNSHPQKIQISWLDSF